MLRRRTIVGATLLLAGGCGPSPPAAPPVALPPIAAELPSPPSPAKGLDRDDLARISVVRRLPHLAPPDGAGGEAIPFDAVRAAIDLASADMFVHVETGGAAVEPVLATVLGGAGMFANYPEAGSFPGALARHHGETILAYAEGTPHLVTAIFEMQALADKTAGLVWDVGTFVTVDGETYAIDAAPAKPHLESGAGPIASWPGVSSPAFSRMAFTTARRTESTPLAPSDRAYAACATRATRGLDGEEGFPKKAPAIRAKCGRGIAAWERALLENIEASVAGREALRESAKRRVTLLDAR